MGQTIPVYAHVYPIPYHFYQEHEIRRYGFHGTSHRYVAQRAADMLGQPMESLKIISCHLGSGASVTAIDGGKSVDTSMGLTPLEGLMMGTQKGQKNKKKTENNKKKKKKIKEKNKKGK